MWSLMGIINKVREAMYDGWLMVLNSASQSASVPLDLFDESISPE